MRQCTPTRIRIRLAPIIICLAVGTAPSLAMSAGAPVHVWSEGFGGTSSEFVWDTAFDVSGNVYVTGSFYGTVDFGNGPHTSAGHMDAFLAKYDAAGNVLWVRTFGSTFADYGSGVGTDAAGNVYLTGGFHRTVDFGNGPITSTGRDTYDLFIAKYDASGNPVWSSGYGGSFDDTPSDIAVNDAGTLSITGGFLGSFSFGGPTLTSTGFQDLFVAAFSSNGVHLWSGSMGGTKYTSGNATDIDNTGNVVVAGYFDETSGGLTSAGLRDIMLVRYDSTGTYQWSKRFGWILQDEAWDVALDNAGNIAMTGFFTDYVTFDNGTTWLSGVAFDDVFVATFDDTGTNLWSRAMGGTSVDGGRAVAFDNAGNVVVTGSFRSFVDFGGGVLAAAGATVTFSGWPDIFFASYDAAGNHLWSERFGNTDHDYGQAVSIGTNGEVWLAGTFQVSADFGGGPLIGNGSSDGFLVRFGQPQPAASITSILDVPADEGGWVTVKFVRSEYDGPSGPQIVSYEIYRAEPPPLAPSLAGVVTATQTDMYSIDVRTRSDVTPHSYMIHARTSTIQFFNSPWMTGYSLDNLAPGIPSNFQGVPPYLLTWDPAPESDFDHFTLYGSSSPVFDATATVITVGSATQWDVSSSPYMYYHLTVSDIAGNEGDAATVVNPATGIGDSPSAGAQRVHAYPNPFNPLTTIRYVVPQSGAVSLSVYDVAGRLVDRLVDDKYRAAGEHRISYRPTATTGAYFVRLESGGKISTARIVLLK